MELVLDPDRMPDGNSSDEVASEDSEDSFDELEPEVVKPRVHHEAVLDPLGRSLLVDSPVNESPKLAPQVLTPKTAEETQEAHELEERQRGRSGRRGSVVQFAGRRAAMSEEAELEATAARLRRARDSNDANEMQSALNAAAPAALMNGPLAAEVQSLAMVIASRLSSDESLLRTGALRKSALIRAKVRRLWQLMVVETVEAARADGAENMERQGSIGVRHGQHDATTERAAGTEGDVSKIGYRMLHMRVAKVLIPPGAINPDGTSAEFDMAEAEAMAEEDWDADVARFSGSSHIMVWLDAIRSKFREASARIVMEYGFSVLFGRLDTDGSGELDLEEFQSAIRTELGISAQDITDADVTKIFQAVDDDGSGAIDAKEFVYWLCGDESEKAKLALMASPRSNPVRDKLKKMSEERSQASGWEYIFEKYDFDGSGELELGEFIEAVRGECKLSPNEISNNDIEELFGVIDADESGAIDAPELCVLLTADLDTPSMTFGPFHASIFELMMLWVPEQTEQAYCNFLQRLFEAISIPVNGHTADEDLSIVPVFDQMDGKTPNFRLRSLDACRCMLDASGALRSDTSWNDEEERRRKGDKNGAVVMTPRDGRSGNDRRKRRQRTLTRTMSNSPKGQSSQPFTR